MSIGNYTIVTRASGTVLTASIYNSDHQNHVNNQNPQGNGAYSDNTAQMQTQTDPGGVGTESLATSTAGELERLRYVMSVIMDTSFWYDYAHATVQNGSGAFTGSLSIKNAGGESSLTVGNGTTKSTTLIDGGAAAGLGPGLLYRVNGSSIGVSGSTGRVLGTSATDFGIQAASGKAISLWGGARTTTGGDVSVSPGGVLGVGQNGGPASSSWGVNGAVQIGLVGSLWSFNNAITSMGVNQIFTGSSSIAVETGAALQHTMSMTDGYTWYAAPSVTAGSVQTFVQVANFSVNGQSFDFGIGSTGTNVCGVNLDSGSGTGGGSAVIFKQNGTSFGGVGMAKAILGANDTSTLLWSPTGIDTKIAANNTTYLTVKATSTIQFNSYGAGALTTDASGNIGVTSDAAFKTNIRLYTRGIDVLRAAIPKIYNYTEESGFDPIHDYTGYVIDQDFARNIPEAVFSSPDGILSFWDRAIHAAVHNTVLAHEDRIVTLESSLAATQAEFAAYKSTIEDIKLKLGLSI